MLWSDASGNSVRWAGYVALASATLDVLVKAAASFSATIHQQFVANSKALWDEVPALMNIATGKESRPPELDKFATAFALAGEKQEMVTDQKTTVFLKRFSPNPDVERAREEFESAQKVEESFHKDFDGADFTLSFTNHIFCLFVGPQSQEDRLTQLVIERPLRKLDLGDQYRLNPLATFHDCRGDA